MRQLLGRFSQQLGKDERSRGILGIALFLLQMMFIAVIASMVTSDQKTYVHWGYLAVGFYVASCAISDLKDKRHDRLGAIVKFVGAAIFFILFFMQ